ncbi:SUKH-4 family immunity protein [Streptomyces sp. NRRL B-24484]|uniref:SUKH-4 family immunity protein n=1 Tax=Streptomyces sp. NRRL B-24484 TaxID=1463833 RepID=UPI0006933801|nr:SUKH-4 family immunity protein [Streptomyces sp. NRRL B-24484]
MNESEAVAAARRPTTDWLESCFGPGTLWRPTGAELPEALENAGVRDFLTTVGVPAVRLAFVDWDSEGLPAKGMWAEDPDEIYGRRRPDDDTPPVCYAYCVGTYGLKHLMVRGDTGVVEVYDPEGWDHARGYGGHAADTLPGLVGALGLLARWEERLTGAGANAALAEFTSLLEELGQGPADSTLWNNLLEMLEGEYGTWEG